MDFWCPTISIHAPARGATGCVYMPPAFRPFQSTLPRGERRRMRSSIMRRSVNFNPRSREGSDVDCNAFFLYRQEFQSTLPRGERRKLANSNEVDVLISIHAPARGATWVSDMSKQFSPFQSTLPRGERPTRSGLSSAWWNFNPRSREGSDPIIIPQSKQTSISIHAPARGATIGCILL